MSNKSPLRYQLIRNGQFLIGEANKLRDLYDKWGSFGIGTFNQANNDSLCHYRVRDTKTLKLMTILEFFKICYFQRDDEEIPFSLPN